LTRSIRDSLLELRDELDHHGLVVNVEELPLTARALDWLESARHAEGYWGVEDVAVTSLACLAIARWRPDFANDRLSISAEWLISQATRGGWETYWDTAVAVQALVAAGYTNHPATQEAIRYLRGLDVGDEQTWSEGIHHAAQIVRALYVTDAPSALLYEWTECVRRHLRTEAGVYVCSQAIYCLISSGTASPDAIQAEIDFVANYLQTAGRPSEGGLRDFTPAIQALSTVPECEELIAEKAGSITAAYTDARAWYKEPRQTAWALIALHSAECVEQIVVDRAAFNSAFGIALAAVPAGQRKARVTAMLLAAGLVLQLEVVAALVAFWNHTTSLAINGGAVAVLALTIPYNIRALVLRARVTP
jgi:hypothetical protein